MRCLAIIPARGGSKRIPRKNVRQLHGRPLLAWTVETARTSGLFDEVMVSTDDAEIAAVARGAGAVVPFLRSVGTADDYATTTDVLTEVLAAYAERGAKPSLVCCLYPAAVLTTPAQLRAGHALLTGDETLDGVMAAQRYRHPIERAFHRAADGTLRRADETQAATRTQDLPVAWHDAGQFYWFRPAVLAETGRLLGARIAPVPLAPWEAVDLDDEDDWAFLERLTASVAALRVPESAA